MQSRAAANRTVRPSTLPTLSQLWRLKIRGTIFLNCVKLADRLILRHSNCEKVGRAPGGCGVVSQITVSR